MEVEHDGHLQIRDLVSPLPSSVSDFSFQDALVIENLGPAAGAGHPGANVGSSAKPQSRSTSENHVGTRACQLDLCALHT